MADRKPVLVRLKDGYSWWQCTACRAAVARPAYLHGTAMRDAHYHARHCEAIALQHLDHDDGGSWCTKGACAWQSTVPGDTDAYLAHYERSHTA